MRFVYPRLGDALALEELARMREMARSDAHQLTASVAYFHPLASPVASGGSVVSEAALRELRHVVLSGLASLWSPGKTVNKADRAHLDRRLGELLHDTMQVVPADAAHVGVWSFLSVRVFPDLVWARFPDLHENRVLGGGRNALRRTWHRHDVLGRLLIESPDALGEDELVGLLERTALARNRPLVRALAKALQVYEGEQARSVFARTLYKSIRHMTGPLLLDALTVTQLEEMVAAVAAGDAWPQSVAAPREADIGWPTQVVAETPVRNAAPGDLVREFHRSMEHLCKQMLKETGYHPRGLLGMLQDQGGVESAKRVAGSPVPSAGFTLLWEKGRLDLTVEALVISREYRGLFAEDLVERAAGRLGEFGYDTSGTAE